MNIDKPSQAVPLLKVFSEKGVSLKEPFSFRSSFQIGRDSSCDITINHSIVSRFHALCFLRDGAWWIKDLSSSNGLFINGRKVVEFRLPKQTRLEFGMDGPVLKLVIETSFSPDSTIVQAKPSVAHYIQRYFKDLEGEDAGEHTRMIRLAFDLIQKKQRWRNMRVISVVIVLFLLVAAYAIHQRRQVTRQRPLAENLFYSMKTLELQLAALEDSLKTSENSDAEDEIRKARSQRDEMKRQYDELIRTFDIYGKNRSKQERIVIRMARIFGECELNIPEGFIKEVLRYTEDWKENTRLEKALAVARKQGYDLMIANTMLAYDLPPHFFYIAFLESDFNPKACGPRTKYGIAKGMWQFIPSTAIHYGLRTGPLYKYRRHDPRDERHKPKESTEAAARYIRYLYTTRAQASGFLVLASYNWGQGNVAKLLNKMPENPKERNFWHLFNTYKQEIPRQTYDYVFKIVSAAVVGENPDLFGFPFDPPLKQAEEQIDTKT